MAEPVGADPECAGAAQIATGNVDPAGLKVLEIGEQALFKMAWPEQTDFVLATSHRGYGAAWSPPMLGPVMLARLFGRVRKGQYDLVVIHPPHYPFWHPRSIAATFKYTVGRGAPLAWPATFFSTFGYALLRFMPDCPMVAVDMADHFSIARHHVFLLDRVHAYYKRELPVDRWNVFYRTGHRSLPTRNFRSKPIWQRRLEKVRPISLAVPPEILDSASGFFGSEKRFDIFFAGQLDATSTVRADGRAALDRLRQKGFSVDVPDKPISMTEFHRRCAQSWLTWSPAGYGWDCVRHQEAPLAGSIPIINTPTIFRHRPMRHGKHCFFYHPDEPDGLERCVADALSDKNRLQSMALAARAHVLDHHRTQALATHIFNQTQAADHHKPQMAAVSASRPAG